ncbi:cation-translocating P-type ATPase [Spirulina major CS-329]|uniref:cation-translocating P-type ATPase n=1 Tax=Spirulina TaxID=1154 RepID=UPI00232BBEFB|nr:MULTISPECIES: cation-translocating P-type ATPase [Spirulina]MDB9495840.1 cation-translocating P-type ATPase [Spirulina subsalsa CS-330]MDB9504652.1 cation-translocating P-type ATPase [Spirulina major CS-329]
MISPNSSLPNPHQSWHSHPVADTLKTLQSDPTKGLTSAEIERRRLHYGSNELVETAGRSRWDILVDQFSNVMLLMLIAVAIISGVLDFMSLQDGTSEGLPFKDTIAILAIVVLNGLLGYIQEVRAEEALASLKQMSSPQVRVIRNGQVQEIEAHELVPGDIFLMEAGVQLAADGQLIEMSNLQIREAALTGESTAVNKQVALDLDENTPLGDRLNMVFGGTEVVQGRGKAIVIATGMDTELGKIATLIQGVENEPTPLQKRMTQLGNVLVTSSLVLVALVVGFGFIQAGNFSRLQELVEVSLSMAVAVVPEGLPAVITVTLAIGTQRMVKRHALIRKLPAVETLGSVNTICSDKTGTLTQNKMVVQMVQTLGNQLRVTGEGYSPDGKFFAQEAQVVATKAYSEIQGVLVAGVLCNDALLQQDEAGNWGILGDPTEGALLTLAGKAGLFQSQLDEVFERVDEIPFSSERKRMSVICCDRKKTDAYTLFCKGSPELILNCCDYYQFGDHAHRITAKERDEVLRMNAEMASQGLRVLGFGYRFLDHLPAEGEDAEQGMVWLGLVGMLDAPRPEVAEAVRRCKAAGIRTIMITGDHQLTASAIAQRLGIAEANSHVLTGQTLEAMSQADLELEVEAVNVYARVSPEHKLRIVKALQKRGKFIAMTGDGVNDAPALKQADIGIAMGITGTDVSKEASDMILLDDNFATIVAATEEGRVVYTNIRRFIKYILGSNVGEVITIAAAPILGLSSIPLTPLQILWMNLVTDGLPALALAVEPAEPNVMQRPPFHPNESIFARGLGSYIVRIGIVFAIFSIVLMVWMYETHPDSWRTMVFTTLCLAQMGHALAARSYTQLTIEMNPFSNVALLAAVIGTTALQLMLVYVPVLRDFFGTSVLTQEELLICFGFSSLMFLWVEGEKLFVRFFMQRRMRPMRPE